MSKIGIVTFFNAINYGVWLQAYATQKALEDMGNEAEMINYMNPHEAEQLRYFNNDGGKVYGYATSFLKSLIFGRVRYYKRAFGNHLNEYYHLSPESYSDVSQMQDVTYDVLVVGSDQVWNPDITEGKLEKVYLLEFGKAGKRMSISSSIGSKPVRDEFKEEFIKAFERFDAISVREDFAAEQLQPLTKCPIKVVCDPTFLLSQEKWSALINEKSDYPCENEKYILTYFVSTDKRSQRYMDFISGYKEKLNLPVWSVQFSTYKNNPCDKLIVGATTADFLKLIQNAELVITDSFHGAALSINLNTNFMSIENKLNPLRIRNLMKRLDLSDRIDMQPEDYKEIDYSAVNEKVKEMREDSLAWIENALNSPAGEEKAASADEKTAAAEDSAKYYAAFFTKKAIRRCSSGGIGYALARTFARDRVVYGVEYAPDFRSARYIRIEDPREARRIIGTKYIATEKVMKDGKSVFQNILADLKEGKKVLYFGLPCEVGGLYKFLQKNGIERDESLITVDLVCHGPVAAKVQADYIDYLEEKYKSKVTDFSVRYKNPYWEPVYLRAAFENGKEHVRALYETDFGRAFMIYGEERCYKCAYKGDGHVADITLGDFWGIKPDDEVYNRMGTSVVITHTEAGDQILHQVKDIELREVNKEKAVFQGSMYQVSKAKNPYYDVFIETYKKEGLHAAVFKARTIQSKALFIAKTILGKQPY